jgi:hypothetical protein
LSSRHSNVPTKATTAAALGPPRAAAASTGAIETLTRVPFGIRTGAAVLRSVTIVQNATPGAPPIGANVSCVATAQAPMMPATDTADATRTPKRLCRTAAITFESGIHKSMEAQLAPPYWPVGTGYSCGTAFVKPPLDCAPDLERPYGRPASYDDAEHRRNQHGCLDDAPDHRALPSLRVHVCAHCARS